MNKKTNGSLSPASHKKQFCSNSTNEPFQDEPFQDMPASFEALIELEDPVRHEFELIKAARSLKIPAKLLQDVSRLDAAGGGWLWAILSILISSNGMGQRYLIPISPQTENTTNPVVTTPVLFVKE